MESEWRIYLQENAPKLYDEMRKELEWMCQWRDNLISELKNKQEKK